MKQPWIRKQQCSYEQNRGGRNLLGPTLPRHIDLTKKKLAKMARAASAGDISADQPNEGRTHLRLYLWPHRMLLIGPGFDTGMHRHRAAQLCFGLDGSLRLRMHPQKPWSEHAAFYVPPDRPHEFAGG